jgi:hypothetical protein
MAQPPDKSAKDAWDARMSAQQAQHAQRSIELHGETIQKKVIFETVPVLRRADAAVVQEVCEHIAFAEPVKTQAGRELVREIGYYKGNPYGEEIRKIVDASLVSTKEGYTFDPSAIMEKLTAVERQAMAAGKTNVQEFMEQSAQRTTDVARKARERKDALQNPPPKPDTTYVPVDRSVGREPSPELRRAYEEEGIKPEKLKRRLDDAWEGRPAKPLFYDREHPKANPEPKKDDGDDKPKKPGPDLKPV